MFDSNLKNAVLAGVLASTVVYVGLHYFGGDSKGMKLDESKSKKSLFENLGESFLFKNILNNSVPIKGSLENNNNLSIIDTSVTN